LEGAVCTICAIFLHQSALVRALAYQSSVNYSGTLSRKQPPDMLT
jgi:hypothetical protein